MGITFVIATSICILLLGKVIQRLFERHKFHEIIDRIPGPKSYPIVGTILNTVYNVPREERWKWFLEFSKQYDGEIFRTWIGEMPNVHLTRAKYLDVILPSTNLIRKSFIYDFIDVWLGTGLLTSTGDKWRQRRKLITPTFHFNILEEFALVMSEKSDILNECIAQEVEKNQGKPIDTFVLLIRTALDIVCEAAMGIESDFQKEHQTEYSVALHSISRLTVERLMKPWLHWDWLYYRTAHGKNFKRVVNLAHNFTHKIIQERKISRMNQQLTSNKSVSEKPKRKAFLDHLLDACDRDGASLSDEELREEVDTFTFAGHDTTAVAMSFALFCIGNDPDVQDKLHREQIMVFGDSEAAATLQDLSRMKYLERVIKETLRLFPSAPTVSRRITEEVSIGGYKLVPGTAVSIHIHQVHRDPEYWPDPEKFDPDRFLPENSQGRHPYAYIPFSAGPRNCIGQKFAMIEAKTILTAVLRKWRVTSLLKQDEIVCCSEIILRPVDGVKIYFTPKLPSETR